MFGLVSLALASSLLIFFLVSGFGSSPFEFPFESLEPALVLLVSDLSLLLDLLDELDESESELSSESCKSLSNHPIAAYSCFLASSFAAFFASFSAIFLSFFSASTAAVSTSYGSGSSSGDSDPEPEPDPCLDLDLDFFFFFFFLSFLELLPDFLELLELDFDFLSDFLELLELDFDFLLELFELPLFLEESELSSLKPNIPSIFFTTAVSAFFSNFSNLSVAYFCT